MPCRLIRYSEGGSTISILKMATNQHKVFLVLDMESICRLLPCSVRSEDSNYHNFRLTKAVKGAEVHCYFEDDLVIFTTHLQGWGALVSFFIKGSQLLSSYTLIITVMINV